MDRQKNEEKHCKVLTVAISEIGQEFFLVCLGFSKYESPCRINGRKRTVRVRLPCVQVLIPLRTSLSPGFLSCQLQWETVYLGC